ncbi:LLM class flavin-dependent oxidoreductase [Amycolatopsis sp. NBC_00345]|uniref:LLM class flavin-dependent oxidoreductase n=1 Tax=Amycolatopsis sp. NBC_00345 TaxID=2975955 RepID=UPI002E272095
MLHLASLLATPGIHLYGWRHPDADPAVDMDFDFYVRTTQAAERAKLDAVFLADSVAVPGYGKPEVATTGKSRYPRLAGLEPISLITALAPLTRNIGLIATMTTTYNEPYHVARRMASVDHLSKGRAGWNLVTSEAEEESLNFGFEQHLEHSQRYVRGGEFHDVVTALWDSWDEDAFVLDKATGQIFDPAKVRRIDHKGEYFTVQGPLNVPRPPQGHPVIAQAGASDPGRELAARTADLVFVAAQTLDEAKEYYDDVKGRLARYGRSKDSLRILAGIVPVVADTDEQAARIVDQLAGFMTDEDAVAQLQRWAGDLDLTALPLDEPLPELPEINNAKGRQKMLVDMARRDNLTLGDLARRFAGTLGHRLVFGSAQTIADDLQLWHESGAADGFMLISPYYPGPAIDFFDKVVPELQRRGIFRTEYSGQTLRDNLEIAVPANQFHNK